MANVNIQLGYKDSAWFAANATLVLLAGQVVYLQQTGTYKIGDGTTQLQNLAFKGISAQTELVVATVVNNTGVNLLASNYQAVKVSTAQGQRLAVDFAQANNDNNSADTIGIVRQNINNNQEGEVVILGTISEVNTTGSLQGETWADGDILYLSPTVAGRITKVKPNGLTGHMVVIGYVEYAHSQHGKIYVKIQNGYELEELHNTADVTYSTPIDADSLLIKDSTASLWKRLTWANLKANLFTLVNVLIGNAPATNQRRLRIGQDTATIDIGSMPGFPSYAAIYMNQSTPSATNYTITSDGSNVYLNTQSTNGFCYITTGNNTRFYFGRSGMASNFAADISGATTSFSFITPAHTGQTASTEISNFKVTGNTKTWANGGGATTIAAQRWNWFSSNTAATSGGGSLTIADDYALYADATIASGVTITNSWALGLAGAQVTRSLKSTGAASYNAIFQDTTSMAANVGGGIGFRGNYTGTTSTIAGAIDSIKSNATDSDYSFGMRLAIRQNGQPALTTVLTFNPTGNQFAFSGISTTGQTASTEINGYLYNSYSRQWAAGAITTQRERYYKSVTYSFNGASTITNAYGAYFEAPIAGTNATITNAYSLGTNGKAKFGGNIELTQTVTTETVTSDTTVIININGVNYKLLAKSI